MSDENDTTSIEASKTGIKVTGKKTFELLTFFLAIGVSVLAYAFYKHENSTKENYDSLAVAIKDLAIATQSQVKEQRVMNCLLSFEQRDRLTRISECERIAR